MATVLVAGATGFVGINIARDLAEAGYDVVAQDIIAPDALAEGFVAPWAERVTWVTGDLADPAVAGELDAHVPELVVNAAAYTPYDEQEQERFRFAFDNNLASHLNLLDLAGRVGTRRFVFVSTMAVYTSEYRLEFDDHVTLAEDRPIAPRHVYGISKVASESMLARYGEFFGVETASVRLAQNWGPMERVTPYHARMSIPYAWARRLARGEPVEASPFGAGVTKGRCLNQDHPYVLDTAAAIRALLEAPELRHDVYNVSAGGPVFLDDLVAAAREVAPDVRFAGDVPADNAQTRPGISLDTARLEADTGFAPAFTLASALEHCVAWRREAGFLD
jgi:nucleoside-diphosphate-sugar epimerase